MSKQRLLNKGDQTDGCHPDMTDRELIVFRAQMSEQANRYEDMVGIMKDICKLYDDLSVDERNLLSCAYKNVIGSRRSSCRILNETLISNSKLSANNEKISNQKYRPALIQSVLSKIILELRSHCNEIIAILDNRLIPSSSATGQARVFYYKMKGDFMRYLCDTCVGAERKERANEALLAYRTASERAMVELPPIHPVRLGLMLNFSVFYYETMKSPERSCRIAKQAFDDAIAELDMLSEESYRDSTIIMQLLRDNLNLWESKQKFQPVNDLG